MILIYISPGILYHVLDIKKAILGPVDNFALLTKICLARF
jgi:hypothetical protein